ncbi:MAG: nucleotidyltransferase domain-containing protein [Jaaginema sp. PMC 1079.18]|nr:nucleotidyltransferase domain-containing protein [Jaaginema sp. PMC 1080.18]MEC4851961.1 nucleotidyltransferase domain-containing protein [Jaaginema sp. PMC 1079.18]MEC4868473.1 nucleotidyltransferase domain-containing protein [Jaaginema sp. PMC 1078.18]
MKLQNIELPRDSIQRFCQQWQIVELALFGSVLRDDFRPDSDLDILVTFEAETMWTIPDLITMQQQLERLVNRKVDFIEKSAIENSHNWIRRQEILNTSQVYYSKL